jgi:hypothetical protein
MSRSASEPLRLLMEEERKELQRVSRASSEPRIHHQRAVALLAVSEGKNLSEAGRLAGWKSHDPVTQVTRRFNSIGLAALDDQQRSGRARLFQQPMQATLLDVPFLPGALPRETIACLAHVGAVCPQTARCWPVQSTFCCARLAEATPPGRGEIPRVGCSSRTGRRNAWHRLPVARGQWE